MKATGEEGKIAVRRVRREMMDKLKKAHKAGDLTDDDLHDLEDQAQQLTNEGIKQVEDIVAAKEQEVLEG